MRQYLAPLLFAVVSCVSALPASAQDRREFKDCAECPAMVIIPPGRITRSDKLNSPEHPLEIRRPFAVSKFEVTWEQFRAFRDATGRDGKGCTRFSIAGDRPMPDRKSTRLNSSHSQQSRMPSSA